jgi:hypothetical protein
VPAEAGLVVEDATGRFCGAVVLCEKDAVTLEDRHGTRRVFPLGPAAFLLVGEPVLLVRPAGAGGMAGAGGPAGRAGWPGRAGRPCSASAAGRGSRRAHRGRKACCARSADRRTQGRPGSGSSAR